MAVPLPKHSRLHLSLYAINPKMRISDHVAEQLYQLVQQRQLAPGQRLPAERQLAETLGVSRSALREAIQKLTSRGLLVSRAGAGTFVQAVDLNHANWPGQAILPLVPLMRTDPQYLYDVLETRQSLEVSTAWYAAQRATAQDKARIQRSFDALLHFQHQQDAASAARADARFHLCIAQASHNAVMVQVMGSLFDLVLGTVAENRHRMFAQDSTPVLEQLTQQHYALMQAILDGEAEQARSVILEHLNFVRDKLTQADADAARQQRLTRLSVPARAF